MNLIVEHLGHRYGSGAAARSVLQPQSWALSNGQQALVRGVSGSGKTTLFNILAGLLRPTSGDVVLNQRRLYTIPEAQRDRFRARHIGYVFQNFHLIGSLSAFENVMMPMIFGSSPGDHRGRARQLLSQLGLADVMSALPRHLSTGQRLRVAVARALVNNPLLLLADEPTASLDAESSSLVMNLLQETCALNDAILLVASHDPALVSRFETVIDLRAGHLYWNEMQPQ